MEKDASPLQNLRRNTGIVPTMAVLVAFVASLLLTAPIRADQSPEEAAAILMTGSWHYGNGNIKRVFRKDGTVTAGKGAKGKWGINGDTLEVYYKVSGLHKFFLPIDPAGTRGVDANGQPAMLIQYPLAGPNASPDADTGDETAAPSPTPPIPADVQQAASKLIQAYHDSLVFVTGTAAAGSGFIASMNGSNFLVTNVHVAAGIRDAQFEKLNGTVVQGGAGSLAVGEDIFCMALPAGGTPFEIMQGVDTNAAVGDAVVVLGNAEGEGVVNTIIGKIVGVGPNLVEVDAPFVPGNSGSPIIHIKSGKVIGVATYLVTNEYDLTTNAKLKQPVVRRFGYRLDTVKKWQPVNWRTFFAQAVAMERIEGLTDDLYDFFRDMDENKGFVTVDRHNNPVIKTRIDDWIAAKGNHASAEDAAEANASFLSFLKIACHSDTDAVQNQITYDYFARELGDQRQTRGEMEQAFQELIQSNLQ